MTETTKYDIDVMFDIETMSTRSDAALVAVAAVPFYLDGRGRAPSPAYWNIGLQSSIDQGLRVDGDAVMWWLRQSEKARRALEASPPVDLWTLFNELDAALRLWAPLDEGGVPMVRVWGHGASFDITILENAYLAAMHQVCRLWRYNAVRDTRTLFHASGMDWDERFKELIGDNEHDALADATAQALMVQEAWSRVRVLAGQPV